MKQPVSVPFFRSFRYRLCLGWLFLLFPVLLGAQEKQYHFYRPLNLEKKWQYVGPQREANYTNLSPGTYTFEVKAANHLGVWTKELPQLHLTILPPWWQTTAFRGLLLAIMLTGLYFFMRWRTKDLEKQNQELEAKVFQRTGELRKRVEELQTVNQISRAAAAELELHNLIKLIGEEMTQTFKAQISYVALLDKESRTIQFPYQTGDQLPPLRLGEGLTSRILLSGEPLLINEDVPGAYRRYDLETVGLIPASYLGVPITAGEETIGVLSVQRTEEQQPFDEDDQRLLSTIAANVGVAIRNARLFEEAQQARAEALKANEAKGSFLSTVSHELRTPLTSIIGFTKITKKRMDEKLLPLIPQDDPKVARAVRQVSGNLEVVVSEGERLTNLINDVLDLAKIEAGRVEWRMEEVNLINVIQRAASATNALFAQKKLPLELDLPEELPLIQADRDRLIQVLINLLSNAAKFTEKGSVTVKARRQGEEILVSVTDTGIGIAPADQAKVFEKFKQAGDTLTDKPQGAGLGLPICQEIVEHHGGQLWLESAVGQGSTFFFTIPMDWDSEAQLQPVHLEELVRQLKQQVPTPTPSKTGQSGLILVVDDEPAIRSLLNQELSEAGYRITEAGNGREALQSVRRERPDLIILDVMMPEMNGFDVAAVLKNDPTTMDIPIIILSILQDKERGMRIGIDRYLTKPIDSDQLFREVGGLLEVGKSPKKVMVVDENASTIKTLGDVLQTRGYQVVEANGAEMIEKAMVAKPDIIVLNALLSDKEQVVKSLRFENGLEHVLFLVYE